MVMCSGSGTGADTTVVNLRPVGSLEQDLAGPSHAADMSGVETRNELTVGHVTADEVNYHVI